MGGMKEYIKTVERYYKIQIDNYAVVNFASFPKIIDSLGGVTITITDRRSTRSTTTPSATAMCISRRATRAPRVSRS